jgi:hypothetical protein
MPWRLSAAPVPRGRPGRLAAPGRGRRDLDGDARGAGGASGRQRSGAGRVGMGGAGGLAAPANVSSIGKMIMALYQTFRHPPPPAE